MHSRVEGGWELILSQPHRPISHLAARLFTSSLLVTVGNICGHNVNPGIAFYSASTAVSSLVVSGQLSAAERNTLQLFTPSRRGCCVSPTTTAPFALQRWSGLWGNRCILFECCLFVVVREQVYFLSDVIIKKTKQKQNYSI